MYYVSNITYLKYLLLNVTFQFNSKTAHLGLYVYMNARARACVYNSLSLF
jgi:hypothetical protein